MKLRRIVHALVRDALIAWRKRSQLWRARLRCPGATLAGTVVVVRTPGTTLELGDGCSIGDYTVLTIADDLRNPSAISSGVIVGAGTYIGEFNNLRAGGGLIRIGDKCLLSQGIAIVASNHGIDRGALIKDQPWDTGKTGVTIGDDVWIGCNAVILPGVTIGKGAVVAAGSVVRADVPEYAIVAGVPARVLRYRE